MWPMGHPDTDEVGGHDRDILWAILSYDDLSLLQEATSSPCFKNKLEEGTSRTHFKAKLKDHTSRRNIVRRHF